MPNDGRLNGHQMFQYLNQFPLGHTKAKQGLYLKYVEQYKDAYVPRPDDWNVFMPPGYSTELVYLYVDIYISPIAWYLSLLVWNFIEHISHYVGPGDAYTLNNESLKVQSQAWEHYSVNH